MKLLYMRQLRCLFICVIIFLCIGCSGPTTLTAPATRPLLTNTVTAVDFGKQTSISSTPSIHATPIFSSTNISTASIVTPTPSPSPIPSLTPTMPPVPTLTMDEEQTLVIQLLRETSTCELPCWWGDIPGITDWQTVYTYFLSLGKEVYTSERLEDHTIASVAFDFPQHQAELFQY